jgi:hypothetical protein
MNLHINIFSQSQVVIQLLTDTGDSKINETRSRHLLINLPFQKSIHKEQYMQELNFSWFYFNKFFKRKKNWGKNLPSLPD